MDGGELLNLGDKGEALDMVRFPGLWEKDPIKGKGGIEFISTRGTKVVVLSNPDRSKGERVKVIRRFSKIGELKGVVAVEQIKRLFKNSIAVEALTGNKSDGSEVENARPLQLKSTTAGLDATFIPEIIGSPNDSRLK